MSIQNSLDLRREDFESRGNDHFLLAIDQAQIAVRVEETDVPRAEEAIAGECRRVFFGPSPVTGHDGGAAHTYLAGTDGDLVVILAS
ncbi:hypothetical protein D3C81_1667130 [compost metagenome]